MKSKKESGCGSPETPYCDGLITLDRTKEPAMFTKEMLDSAVIEMLENPFKKVEGQIVRKTCKLSTS